MNPKDPMERAVAAALDAAAITWVDENDQRALGLDFFLPDFDIHIEVKQMHSDRVVDQTARVKNIIVIQGLDAARAFARMLAR